MKKEEDNDDEKARTIIMQGWDYVVVKGKEDDGSTKEASLLVFISYSLCNQVSGF